MAATSNTNIELDKGKLIKFVDDPNDRFIFHSGEGFRYEKLPVGTRLIYPPPPLPGIVDLEGAIESALENPLDSDPFSAQIWSGMRITIAFDDLSVPLPPMKSPDIRQLIIERVLTKYDNELKNLKHHRYEQQDKDERRKHLEALDETLKKWPARVREEILKERIDLKEFYKLELESFYAYYFRYIF